jgi:hypothetical protein
MYGCSTGVRVKVGVIGNPYISAPRKSELHGSPVRFPNSIRVLKACRIGHRVMVQLRSGLLDGSKNVISLDERRPQRLGSQRGKAWGLWVVEYFTPEPHRRWQAKLGMFLIFLALCSFWVAVGYGISAWL